MKTTKYGITLAAMSILPFASAFGDWTYDPVNTDDNTKTADYYIPAGDFTIDTTNGSLTITGGRLFNQQDGDKVIKGNNTSSLLSDFTFTVTGNYIQNRKTMTWQNVNISASWLYNENAGKLFVDGVVKAKNVGIQSKGNAQFIIKDGASLEVYALELQDTVFKIENGRANTFRNNWEVKTTAASVISIDLSNDSLECVDANTAIMQTLYTKVLNGKIELDLTNFSLGSDFVEGTQHTIALVNSRSGQNGSGQFDVSWLVEEFNVTNGEFAEFVSYEKNGNLLYVTIEAVNNPIPEPGTYAVIFGALALAFAAYKRRKS